MPMAKGENLDSPAMQKYGIPFYSAAWIPYKELKSKLQSEDQARSDGEQEDSIKDPSAAATSEKDGDSSKEPEAQKTVDGPDPASEYYVVLAGGGGEGRSGIANAIVLVHFDLASNSLSTRLVTKHILGSELPYRMTVHPGGDGLICAMQNGCRFFEWDEIKENGTRKLDVKISEKALDQLQEVGQQLALVYDSDGSTLAVGGEEGDLRIFKWPSMEMILNEAQAHSSTKYLCFSPDGKFLVSLGGRGPGRVWDVPSAKVIASLSNTSDEVFASCRFVQSRDNTLVLYIAAITGKGGSIVTWNASSWKRLRSKHVVGDSISSFNVSPDGRLLAMGTARGDVVVVDSAKMRVQMVVRKAHLGFVTALAFSHDSKALASASMDSSARVTLIKEKRNGMYNGVKPGGWNWWVIVMVILLVIIAYFLMIQGLLPDLDFGVMKGRFDE
ncbi:SEC12-like protein 2 [Linum perenne]